MARHEADREDLFAELLSYEPRWEIFLGDSADPYVIGLRPDDRWVIYRPRGDYDQFTWKGELRRAFRDRRTFISTGSTLAVLTKDRSKDETTLRRNDITEKELSHFRYNLGLFLTQFDDRLKTGSFRVNRALPANADLITAILPLVDRALSHDLRLAPCVTPR